MKQKNTNILLKESEKILLEFKKLFLEAPPDAREPHEPTRKLTGWDPFSDAQPIDNTSPEKKVNSKKIANLAKKTKLSNLEQKIIKDIDSLQDPGNVDDYFKLLASALETAGESINDIFNNLGAPPPKGFKDFIRTDDKMRDFLVMENLDIERLKQILKSATPEEKKEIWNSLGAEISPTRPKKKISDFNYGKIGETEIVKIPQMGKSIITAISESVDALVSELMVHFENDVEVVNYLVNERIVIQSLRAAYTIGVIMASFSNVAKAHLRKQIQDKSDYTKYLAPENISARANKAVMDFNMLFDNKLRAGTVGKMASKELAGRKRKSSTMASRLSQINFSEQKILRLNKLLQFITEKYDVATSTKMAQGIVDRASDDLDSLQKIIDDNEEIIAKFANVKALSVQNVKNWLRNNSSSATKLENYIKQMAKYKKKEAPASPTPSEVPAPQKSTSGTKLDAQDPKKPEVSSLNTMFGGKTAGDYLLNVDSKGMQLILNEYGVDDVFSVPNEGFLAAASVFDPKTRGHVTNNLNARAADDFLDAISNREFTDEQIKNGHIGLVSLVVKLIGEGSIRAKGDINFGTYYTDKTSAAAAAETSSLKQRHKKQLTQQQKKLAMASADKEKEEKYISTLDPEEKEKYLAKKQKEKDLNVRKYIKSGLADRDDHSTETRELLDRKAKEIVEQELALDAEAEKLTSELVNKAGFMRHIFTEDEDILIKTIDSIRRNELGNTKKREAIEGKRTEGSMGRAPKFGPVEDNAKKIWNILDWALRSWPESPEKKMRMKNILTKAGFTPPKHGSFQRPTDVGQESPRSSETRQYVKSALFPIKSDSEKEQFAQIGYTGGNQLPSEGLKSLEKDEASIANKKQKIEKLKKLSKEYLDISESIVQQFYDQKILLKESHDVKTCALINNSDSEASELTQLITSFYPYAQKKLGFESPVSAVFISDKENMSNPLGKTAYYDPANMQITLYVDGRHPKDILRSFSHELVHHSQNCRGQFDEEASTELGYAQKNPHLRKMEAEAYLLGNGFLVRDYEDFIKQQKQKFNGE